MSGFILKNKDKVVFIGDSITDCGRREANVPYGSGYVKFAIDLICAKYPERDITFYNKGISGNVIEDLYNRWHDDVLVLKPDWVIVKIGINDIHRTLRPNNEPVPVDKYRKLYKEILSQTKEKLNAKIVLIDPFYVSADFSDNFRGKVLRLIPEYIEVVSEMSKEFKAIHVETHDAFKTQLKFKTADYFCPEPVHPYPNGHTIIAYELLKKLKW